MVVDFGYYTKKNGIVKKTNGEIKMSLQELNILWIKTTLPIMISITIGFILYLLYKHKKSD